VISALFLVVEFDWRISRPGVADPTIARAFGGDWPASGRPHARRSFMDHQQHCATPGFFTDA